MSKRADQPHQISLRVMRLAKAGLVPGVAVQDDEVSKVDKRRDGLCPVDAVVSLFSFFLFFFR
jgi:hypothetical protein